MIGAGNMRELKIGVVGRIVSGIDADQYLEIIDDYDVSGGYLILTYENRDRSGEGYDAWVETIINVDLFFEESGWEVEWLEP